MTGHREAENTAKQLHDVFGSRVDDGTTVPLGDIDYFRMQHTYQAKSSTNFLLNVIFRLSERIADLRQTVKLLNPLDTSSEAEPDQTINSPVDAVSHPSHYSAHNRECIVEMLVLFGLDNFITFCQMNAWKYRYRAGNKANNSADQDNAKADRYIEYSARARKIEYWDIDPMILTDDGYWNDYYKHVLSEAKSMYDNDMSADGHVGSPGDACDQVMN